jgi:hypothetical protein
MIPGYKIIEHYVGKDVGDVDAWQGVLNGYSLLVGLDLCFGLDGVIVSGF